jgi:hypothetical protein
MKKRLMAMVIILIILVTIASCSQTENEQRAVYENIEWGFRIEFPNEWTDMFKIAEHHKNPEVLDISSPQNKIDLLGSINKHSYDEWAAMDKSDIPSEFVVMYEDDSVVYVCYFPTDINWDITDQKSFEAYSAMIDDIREENYVFTKLP